MHPPAPRAVRVDLRVGASELVAHPAAPHRGERQEEALRGGEAVDVGSPGADPRVGALRDRLWDGLRTRLEEITRNGDPEHTVPGVLNVSFAYVEGESLMMAMEDVAVSSGSACTSASLEPSYVLKALGVRDDLAHGSIRFSVGRFNTQYEIDYVIGRVAEAVNRLREMSPLWELAQEGVDLKSVQWQPH